MNRLGGSHEVEREGSKGEGCGGVKGTVVPCIHGFYNIQEFLINDLHTSLTMVKGKHIVVF